jgi:hypothetical protein
VPLTFQKTPWVLLNLTRGPSPNYIVPAVKERVEGLTGGEIAPVRWSGRRGGRDGHADVRIVFGDGQSRPVHVRRRGSSSAARAPAYPRR